jgi:drug/metabolite transporter (DMT)-like permease
MSTRWDPPDAGAAMSWIKFGWLLGVVGVMAAGQILFKAAADSMRGPLTFSLDTLLRLMLNPYLVGGVAVYALNTVLWVAVLREVELSRAYPFVALPLVIVPLVGIFLFHEPWSNALLVGGAFIVAGVWIIARFS